MGAYFVPTISAGKWGSAKKPDTYPAIVQPKARAVGAETTSDPLPKAYKKGVKIAFGY